MSFRSKIIFFGLIGLLVIVGLILAIVFRSKKMPTTEEQTPGRLNGLPAGILASPTVPSAEVKKPPLSPAELSAAQKELALKNQAKLFTERFGSYSPAANFANFDELKSIVTPSVAIWLEQYKKQLLAKQAPEFLGVTTVVVSQKIISSADKQASVMVSTQQEEMLASGTKISYRDMLLKLVWQDNRWLVDGAYWQ